MTKITTRDVLIGRVDGGFFAATSTSPYFCVYAETEDDVKAKVRKAFAIYERYELSQNQKVSAVAPIKRTVSTLLPTKRIPREEFAIAV